MQIYDISDIRVRQEIAFSCGLWKKKCKWLHSGDNLIFQHRLHVPLMSPIPRMLRFFLSTVRIWVLNCAMLYLVTQSCPTLCDPVDCSLPGSSVHGDSPGKNTGVGCHALLQGIFPTQGSNPGLPHCRWILLLSEPPGKPKNTGVGSLSLLQGIFSTQESNWGLLHYRWILYRLSYKGNPYKSLDK